MASIASHGSKRLFRANPEQRQADQSMEEEQCVEDSREEVGDEDMQEDGYSEASDESEGEVDPLVKEDMEKFQNTFKGIRQRFRLINRIGEGTFSTVYKAEDLLYKAYVNDWDIDAEDETIKWSSPPLKRQGTLTSMEDSRSNHPRYVAIKKIYVTSSPNRILNELELLHDLRGQPSICPLITAFRHTDQVVAILPYFRHTDFRDYFRRMTVPDMQIYFRSLFTALAAVHDAGILHRDIKPTNFLYDPSLRRGVLVDFGLAEKEGTDSKPCLCRATSTEQRRRVSTSVAATTGPSHGYPKNDSRPSRRANRAGTRGFRAPEVLFKCTAQTAKIDIWSAGVILLTILSRRFPFFNSADDVEAMIEVATIFGIRRMKSCAYLHGTQFETTIPTIGNAGFTLEKIILWSTCRNGDGESVEEDPLREDEKLAVKFLEDCLELDPRRRIGAREALEHEFLREKSKEELEMGEEDELHMLQCE